MWGLKGLGNLILSKIYQILVKLLFFFAKRLQKLPNGPPATGVSTPRRWKSIIAKQISFKPKILATRLSSAVCADDQSFTILLKYAWYAYCIRWKQGSKALHHLNPTLFATHIAMFLLLLTALWMLFYLQLQIRYAL